VTGKHREEEDSKVRNELRLASYNGQKIILIQKPVDAFVSIV